MNPSVMQDIRLSPAIESHLAHRIQRALLLVITIALSVTASLILNL
jgi:hypothetical protein